MYVATCCNCAGIAVNTDLHACASTVPTAYIWDNCSNAFACISALAPPANKALLNAKK